MKKTYLLVLFVALMLLPVSGCANKRTDLGFNQNTTGTGAGPVVSVLVIQANGSKLETETNQDAKGELPLGELVKKAVDGAVPGIPDLGKIADAIKGEDEKEDTNPGL